MAFKDWLNSQKSPEVGYLKSLLAKGIDMARANGIPEDQVDDWVNGQIQRLEQSTGLDLFGEAAKEEDPWAPKP